MSTGYAKPLHLVALLLLSGVLGVFLVATRPADTPPGDSAVQALSIFAQHRVPSPLGSEPSQQVVAIHRPADTAAWQLARLLKYSRISEQWLDQHGFLSNRDALAKLAQLLDGHPIAATQGTPTLTMAPHPHALPMAETDLARISQGERYVQTSLPTSATTGLATVVIRWRSLDGEFVQELSVQPIPTNSTETPTPIWMYRPEGWPVGRYVVEVFSGTVDLQPVATGKFEIVTHGQPVTPQAYWISKDRNE